MSKLVPLADESKENTARPGGKVAQENTGWGGLDGICDEVTRTEHCTECRRQNSGGSRWRIFFKIIRFFIELQK